MIKANFNIYNNYVTDNLYQWDKDQDLIITGLNLEVAPEVHFSNANMDKSIVRQSTLENGVVTVRIPNSLLQESLTIVAHIGIYEGTTFNTIETIGIPIITKPRPSDYTISDDEEIYSFNKLENDIKNVDLNSRRYISNAVGPLEARLNNLISDGTATEGNTELLDIRVDMNGVIHDSAGEAVREQARQIVTKLDEVSVLKVGKNFFNPTDSEHLKDTQFTDTGAFFNSSNYTTTKMYYPNGEPFITFGYLFSNGITYTSMGDCRVLMYMLDGTVTAIQGSTVSLENVKSFRVGIPPTYVNILERITFNYEPELTTYEPYHFKWDEEFIDDEISDQSDNPVKNKIISAELTTITDELNNIKQNLQMPTDLLSILGDGQHHRVKLLGDSITHGVGGTGFAQDGEQITGSMYRNPNGYCWANLFKANLEALYDCDVINNACRGTEMRWLVTSWGTLVDAEDDIVIVMYGTNDRTFSNDNTLFKGYCRQIIEQAKLENKHLFFICSIPSSRALENGENTGYIPKFSMREVDSALCEVTSGKYISLYKKTLDFMSYNDITDLTPQLSADGLHPNDYLHNKMFLWVCEGLGIPISINDMGVPD